jgi:hypothetical protein
MNKSYFKQLIKEEILKVLNEKYYEHLVGDEYGEGGQHQIYDYGKEGDKVIKFPYGRGKIGYNVKILAKYPEIFPEVFDIGEDHIILEKLNDKKAYNEVWKIKPYLFANSSEIPPKNPYIAKLAQRSRIKGPNYYDSTLSELIYNNLDDKELKLQLYKELPNDLYNSLIKNWYPLLQKVKNLPWKSQIEKDINDENFGYNSKGELKMLDI